MLFYIEVVIHKVWALDNTVKRKCLMALKCELSLLFWREIKLKILQECNFSSDQLISSSSFFSVLPFKIEKYFPKSLKVWWGYSCLPDLIKWKLARCLTMETFGKRKKTIENKRGIKDQLPLILFYNSKSLDHG